MSAEDALALLAAAEDVLAGSETRMVRYAGGRVTLTQTPEGSEVGAQRSPGGKWRCATIYTEELAWLVKAPRAGVGSAPAKRRGVGPARARSTGRGRRSGPPTGDAQTGGSSRTSVRP